MDNFNGGICGDGVKIFLMLTPSIKSAFKCPNGTDKNTLYHKILKVWGDNEALTNM